MTAEWKHDTEPAIGAEIAALRNLTAEVTGDLTADERLVAVSWGRTGRKIFTVYPWAAGLVLLLASIFAYATAPPASAGIQPWHPGPVAHYVWLYAPSSTTGTTAA